MIGKTEFLALSIAGRFEWVISYLREVVAKQRPGAKVCLARVWFNAVRVPVVDA